ncbi:MAG: hypothetical protein U9Q77_08455 [Candidatus Marinimicrobia bacterium]|nr:hypothetical protein [Candidatus Neomarinimicrobiota bacterium]
MSDKSDQPTNRWLHHVWQSHTYNKRQQLKTGTYLKSFCPHCQAELTHDSVLTLEVINSAGDKATVDLSPYLNDFSRKTKMELPEGEQVYDVLCTYCHKTLIVEGLTCERGDSRVASFLVGIGNVRVPFYICTREGCHWHAISPDDSIQIQLEDSNEW